MEKTVLRKLLPSRSGAVVMAGLIAFGVIILGGLYISPAAKARPVPANTPVGAPAQKLRFVCYSWSPHSEDGPAVLHHFKSWTRTTFSGEDIDEDDVVEAVQLLQMQNLFHPRLLSAKRTSCGETGNMGKYSSFPSGRCIAAEAVGGRRGGFGVWAVSVVDGKQFFVACMHFSPGEAGAAEMADLEKTWKGSGSPPMVAGMLFSDPNPPTAIRAFSAIDPRSNGQWFDFTKDWRIAGFDRTPVCRTGTHAGMDRREIRSN